MFQEQVDTGCDEGWSEYQTHDLKIKIADRPGIGVHENAAHIARHLHQNADTKGYHERPRSKIDAQPNLTNSDDAEENGKEDIPAQVWVITVSCSRNWAGKADFCTSSIAGHDVQNDRVEIMERTNESKSRVKLKGKNEVLINIPLIPGPAASVLSLNTN